MADFKLPLYVKKAVRAMEPKKDSHLQKLGEVLGGEWTLVPNLEKGVSEIFGFFKDGESFAESNREKLATGLVELFYDVALGSLVKNLTAIAEDELSKEALEETVTVKEVRFSLDIDGAAKGKPGNPMSFDEGALNWVVDRGDVANMHGQYDFFTKDLGKNLEKLL